MRRQHLTNFSSLALMGKNVLTFSPTHGEFKIHTGYVLVNFICFRTCSILNKEISGKNVKFLTLVNQKDELNI